MAVQRIRFVGGEVLTEPAPLKLKRGDEVIFTMEDDSFASVRLSFQPPSPFEPSEITLRAGEQATLIVKHNVSKTKVRFVATPQPKEPNPPPPIVLPSPPIEEPPPIVPPPSEESPPRTGSDPPGTVLGDVDVIPVPEPEK
ncbi:MAG TPA: hypothetical protein VF664_06580 [Cystobacter sp.]